jgi:hypothetical protein
MKTDLVRNALSISTESTNNFHGYALDYKNGNAVKIDSVRPLVREGAPQKQDRNCQTVIINIWSWAPDGARHQDLLTDWPSVAMWLWLWLWLIQSWFRRQFSSWVFSCGVVTSGQRKPKKWPIRKSGPSQSHRREDTRSPVRNGASLRQSLIVSCCNLS